MKAELMVDEMRVKAQVDRTVHELKMDIPVNLLLIARRPTPL